MNTFYSFCVSACIFVIFITGAISFVNALGVFPVEIEVNDTPTMDVKAQFWDVLFQPLGAGILIGLTGALAIAVLTQSLSIVGIYLFSVTFWTTWGQMLYILSLGNFLVGAMATFMGLITVGMGFIFGAAVIGMMSGSG